MKEKELRLEIDGKEYSVVIKDFTAYEARIAVEGQEYTVGLKDLGLDQVAEIKPVRSRRFGEPEQPKGPTPTPVRSLVDKKPDPTALHRPTAVVNTRSVVAPLPGQVQHIHVQVGDVIRSGQTVLTLEAMKMENEIHSTTEGVVQEIRCREGDSVNQGDILIVLDYLEE